MLRMLRSGGVFAASDWQTSHDGEMSPLMQRYQELEGLGFAKASERYIAAIRAAGFTDVSTRNRTPWYTVAAWNGMIAVLETCELCPHHLRGYKP